MHLPVDVWVSPLERTMKSPPNIANTSAQYTCYSMGAGRVRYATTARYCCAVVGSQLCLSRLFILLAWELFEGENGRLF